MLSKLVPVVGNVCESDLGLDGDLGDVIAKEVDIIVNSAANTTFDERLWFFTLFLRLWNYTKNKIITTANLINSCHY